MPKLSTSEQLLRLANGELPSAEAEALRHALDASPELQQQWQTLQATQTLLQEGVAMASEQALRPFFTDRLMRRLEATTRRAVEEEMFSIWMTFFRPIAIAGVVIILGLVFYNINVAQQYEAAASATETVLALPPVSLESAYELDLAATYASLDL